MKLFHTPSLRMVLFAAIAVALFHVGLVSAEHLLYVGFAGATLAATNPTLQDVAKRVDPNGKIDSIVELLNQTNGALEDMSWVEGNLPTGHKSTVRTGLPAPTWRKLYGGVQPAKSTTVQVTDSCGMLEAYAEVDKALADLNNNEAAFRMSEDAAFIEGMAQEHASTLFYGNEGTEPEAFTGLTPRYNVISAQNGDNIINHGGVGSDNTSIWLCVWGPQTGFGIYPKGSKAGLQMSDKGQVTVENAGNDSNFSGRFEAYRSHYRWDAGLVIRDWRFFVRIGNIDVSVAQADATGQKAIINSMVKATERIPSFGKGRACFYMNRSMREVLRLGILEKISSNLSWETVTGKRVMTFDDIPVRRMDALTNAEAVMTA
jgi:hypothetical protein